MNIVSLEVRPEFDFSTNVPDALIYATMSLFALELKAANAASFLGLPAELIKFIVFVDTPAVNALLKYPPI